MKRTHQTFSEHEKNKLLREIENFYRAFAVLTLEVRSLRSSACRAEAQLR